jgi:asparagine synthase (glutamine-hydrolysing)
MCGIVASFAARSQVDASAVESAVLSLKHRGPDSSGVWLSEDRSVALGHTRLALRGVSSGHQPLVDTNTNLSLVVNGELYDYAKLRLMLTKLGCQFKTGSDSELAIHLYKVFGRDFTQYLRGEFSLVLWDGSKRRLIAIRDRFGIKPLVYVKSNEGLSLASESKALFALGHEPKWSEKSVLHSFAHQYLPADSTLFAGIKQLPPAHILCYENDKLELSCYWHHAKATSGSEYRESQSSIADLLEDSIEQRLESESSVAFSLSGGIDSSLLVAIAAEKMSEKPNCFNISFFDKNYDERDLAQRFCSNIGAEFHEVSVSADDLVYHCGEAAYYSEGIGINGQYVGKFLLSQAVNKAGFKVMLSGEGADEAFLGYAHLQQDYYLHHGLANSKSLLDTLNESFPLQSGLMMSSKTSKFEGINAFVPSFLKTKLNMTEQLLPFLRQRYQDGHFRIQSLKKLLMTYESINLYNNLSPVEKSVYIWTNLAMAGYILKTLGDGMEMAHSVEGRPPFLDHHLFESAKRIPLEKSIVGTQSKKALRVLASSYLPENISNRKKHPFIAPPVISSLSNKGKSAVYDLLETNTLIQNPFFEPNNVRKWLDKIFKARLEQQKAADPCLMMLLSMTALQRKFSLNDYL